MRDALVMPSSFEVQLTVTVLAVVDGRDVWCPCPQLAELGGVDLVRSWRDVAAVLRGQGAVVGCLLAATTYRAYRVAVRGVVSGRMLALGEWRQSDETSAFRVFDVWTAEGYIPLDPSAVLAA